MDQLLISVIIPTYNSQQYLREALESVINQSYKNLQILILDDGSSDDSVLISRSFTDPRIELYESKVNKGQSYQLNRGIIKSKGAFVCIMHSDDVMHENKLAEQLSFLMDNPSVGICGCNVQLIGEKSGTWLYPKNSKDCKDLLLFTVPVAHPTVLFRKSVFDDMDYIYDQQMVPVEDYDLWVRLVKKTNFGNIQKVLLDYRIHPNQIGNIEKKNEKRLILEIRKRIISELFNIVDEDTLISLKALYYPEEQSVLDTIKGIDLLWEANKKKGVFSKEALKGRLKHTVFSKLSDLSLISRFKYLFANPSILEIAYFKTAVRILFTLK